MHVLVAVASRHGSTLEMGRYIADALEQADPESELRADLQAVESVTDLAAYDAVVLGSAVYAGHWLRSARDLVDRYETELQQLPLWLFSSGPVGDPPRPNEDPVEVAAISSRLAAREHRLFSGRLDPAELGLTEKALVKLVRAKEGDYRSWSEMASWATSIAVALRPVTARLA